MASSHRAHSWSSPRGRIFTSAWAALLVLGFTVARRPGPGTLLTSAFILQVTPSMWMAYRTDRPTGTSRGTWILIFGELSYWTIFGIHMSDSRLIILGFTAPQAFSCSPDQRPTAMQLLTTAEDRRASAGINAEEA